MIKRYNQFVKENLNEDFNMGGEQPEIAPAEPTTRPDTTEKPQTDTPSRPSPFRKDRQSPIPAPAKAFNPKNNEPSMELGEEEVGEYKGTRMMVDLAGRLGVEVSEDGSINYEGKKINFYSETEAFHIGKDKFETIDEVLDFLGVNNEFGADDVDDDFDSDEFTPTDYKDDDEYDMEVDDFAENDGRIVGEDDIDIDEDEDDLGEGDDLDIDEDEIDNQDQFESKSYRFKRYRR